MTGVHVISILHWKTYICFMGMVLNNQRNMYGKLYRDVKNIHDVVHAQDYSINDLYQIFYN
jgi:hypothetical protein